MNVKRRSLLSSFAEGVASLFTWVGETRVSRTQEERDERLDAMLQKHGLIWHTNDRNALASDWKAGGRDLKQAMNNVSMT